MNLTFIVWSKQDGFFQIVTGVPAYDSIPVCMLHDTHQRLILN